MQETAAERGRPQRESSHSKSDCRKLPRDSYVGGSARNYLNQQTGGLIVGSASGHEWRFTKRRLTDRRLTNRGLTDWSLANLRLLVNRLRTRQIGSGSGSQHGDRSAGYQKTFQHQHSPNAKAKEGDSISSLLNIIKQLRAAN
jgi:hypothetical protein